MRSAMCARPALTSGIQRRRGRVRACDDGEPARRSASCCRSDRCAGRWLPRCPPTGSGAGPPARSRRQAGQVPAGRRSSCRGCAGMPALTVLAGPSGARRLRILPWSASSLGAGGRAGPGLVEPGPAAGGQCPACPRRGRLGGCPALGRVQPGQPHRGQERGWQSRRRGRPGRIRGSGVPGAAGGRGRRR